MKVEWSGVMAKHQGWQVKQHAATGRLMAMARDPATQKYRTKLFDTNERERAKAWAQREYAQFLLALQTIPEEKRTVILLDRYVAELKRRNRHPHHVEEVGRVLGTFATVAPFLDHPRFRDQARAWLDQLAKPNSKPLAATTRNRYLLHIRAFMRFALDEEWLLRDPLRRLAPLMPIRDAKPQFTLAELETIARAVDDPLHPYIACLLWGGMRRSEPAALTWGRVDWRGGMIRVRGKGNKDRLVPLQDELAVVLQALGPGPSESLIFPQYHGGEALAVMKGFQRLLERLGIPRERRTCHSLRHCYAGLMTASGVPSLSLAQAMGHETMDTTKHYATYAMRYQSEAGHWPAGQFQLLKNWTQSLAPLDQSKPMHAARVPVQPLPASRQPAATTAPDDLLGVKEIRAMARCRLDRVRQAVKNKCLPIHLYGPRRAVLVRRADAEAWIAVGGPET
jgi:integrase/recombinase XerD